MRVRFVFYFITNKKFITNHTIHKFLLVPYLDPVRQCNRCLLFTSCVKTLNG